MRTTILTTGLALVAGCGLIDAANGPCDQLADCGTGEVCTADGCALLLDVGPAHNCERDSQCFAHLIEDAGPTMGDSIGCPDNAVCQCIAGGCVSRKEPPVECNDPGACGPGQYCNKADSACYQPLACGRPSDCSSGEVCATEGCVVPPMAPNCSNGCGSGTCINNVCFLQTSKTCTSSTQCSGGELCFMNEGRCHLPLPPG